MSDGAYYHETTKTYDIPLKNLDFKYIKECENISELEKILKTLRSGEVGRFKELEDCCEEKLRHVDPENRLLRKPVPLGTINQLNEQDREDVLTDLQEWISGMREESDGRGGENCPGVEEMVSRIKERRGLRDASDFEKEEERTIEYDEPLPPIRRELCFKANSQFAARRSGASDGFTGKRVLKPRDYSEWDRLEKEWDKELNEESSTMTSKPLDRVDEKGERMSLSESETHGLSKLSFTDLAKRVRNMPEHTRRQVATKEKEKGNEAFKAGDYNEALMYYKRSLICLPTSAVYNNRALIHLHRKEWSLAAKDCARVLKEEPNNVKALFRSGRANYELHNLDEAERVLEQLTDQDPTFAKAQNLLRSVRVEKSKRQARKLEGGRRMVITDVGDSSESSDDELPKMETVSKVECTSSTSIPIKTSSLSGNDLSSNQKTEQADNSVTPMLSDRQTPSLIDTEDPNGDKDETKESHQHRVRRRVVYPPSNPGRKGMVIEELSDTELDQSKRRDDTMNVMEDGKTESREGMRLNRKKTDFVSNIGDAVSVTQITNLNYEDAKALGAESRAKGNLEEAFQCYTRCIEVSRDASKADQLAAAYRNRAIVALDFGRYQCVVDDCTEALKLQPRHPTSLYRRALGRRGLGDLSGAVTDLEEAHKLLPNSVNIRTELETSRQQLHSNSYSEITCDKQLASEFETDAAVFEADQPPISVSPDPDWDIVGESAFTVSANVIKPGDDQGDSESVPTDEALRLSIIQRLEIQQLKPKIITPNVFQARWISVVKLKNTEKRRAISEILCDIQPDTLPTVIGIKLDAFMLDEIIQTLEWLCNTETPCSTILDFTYNILMYLSQVPRFNCGLLLVSDETTRAVNILLELLQRHGSDEQHREWKELEELRANYTTGF